MVKVPKDPVTPIEPRDPEVEPPVPTCPGFEVSFEVLPIEVGTGSRADAQLRDGRIRILANGQILGWADDALPEVVNCMERGVRYSGSVTRADASGVTVRLESG